MSEETFVAYKEHRDSQTCVLLKTDQYEDVWISEMFKTLNKKWDLDPNMTDLISEIRQAQSWQPRGECGMRWTKALNSSGQE